VIASSPCTVDSHEALKLTPEWSAIPELGRQPFPAVDSEPAMELVMKNCPRCNSTLAVEVGCGG
jgi:hypothetical protein